MLLLWSLPILAPRFLRDTAAIFWHGAAKLPGLLLADDDDALSELDVI